MESVFTDAEAEAQFLEQVEKRPLSVATLLQQIQAVAALDNGNKADEWTTLLVQELVDDADFNGLFAVLKERAQRLAASLTLTGFRDILKKAAAKDRLTGVLVDTAAFGEVPLEESFRRLDILLALVPGVLVIDANWGIGTVRRLDDFYKRVTIDFDGKPGHAMSFAAACDSLIRAPRDHLLTLRHDDPEGMRKMAQDNPGEIVRLALRSFSNMPVTRLEDVLVKNGFVPAPQWKAFWEGARKALRNDPLVSIPSKRTEPIELRIQAETHGDAWFRHLATTKDPVKILNLIVEFEQTGKLEGLEDTKRGILEDRLTFAITGARNTDAPLYARLAMTVSRLGFPTPPADELRAHLWEHDRYIKAAESLHIRDTEGLVAFLLAEGSAVNARLLDAIPQMPYSFLDDVLAALKDLPETASACCALLSQAKAPPTLVNWVFRSRQSLAWEGMPSLIVLLGHAIEIIESKLSGESLRMQNSLKQLFGQPKWMETVFEALDLPQRQFLFERIQASAAWDPATHRSLLARMLKLDPSLAERKKVVQQQAHAAVRQSSWRAVAEKQTQYKRLIEVELPKNSNDIAVARSYGDLRENFEYQAAKDFQRQLLQRQSELQAELKQVKGTDFSNVPHDKVGPGTTVALRLADGTVRTYTILGEWDHNEALGIISCQTRMAIALDGKRPGETVAIPAADGEAAATVEAVGPFSDAIRQWINSPPEEA
ncbi:MAG: GreA/GreB family elongation factor [Kiritimatiellaeota bacterium]|nr:GreA/GreB family elongation factor [Kiritimatiellota bacterium]